MTDVLNAGMPVNPCYRYTHGETNKTLGRHEAAGSPGCGSCLSALYNNAVGSDVTGGGDNVVGFKRLTLKLRNLLPLQIYLFYTIVQQRACFLSRTPHH